MKKTILLGMIFVWLLTIFQPQIVYADDYDDFRNELNRNNIRNIERLLERRSRRMDLAYCMTITLGSRYVRSPNGFNRSNCLDVLRLLIRYGADVNEQFVENSANSRLRIEHQYPLENAISQEHSLSVIQFLLDSGANPNLSSDDSSVHEPPILRAYRKNNTAAVNLLLDRGANGATILRSAGSRGDNEIIRLLISRGVQIRSEQGAEALRWAAVSGHFDTIKLLVENGVNINARSNDNDRYVQEYIPIGATAASIAYDRGEMEIYNYLKANGAIDFEPRQAVQPGTPAVTPLTTNVYITPSAPAESTPSPVPSTPTLQTGRYAWSNSGTNMTMTLSSGGMVSAFLNNSPIGVWHGTYRINGNQLVITVSNPTSDYANLRGQTYAYTITSSTSFSGSGETWVRTGSF